ncbi:MAG: sigma 54-interacting transcriptional regulator [Synergistaceae bacterium]|jgi:transcriptional regulator with PAS, ATPase and Fis domain|nr:sigma 54-interacting transcriptional regulator [Synergistaceae bacterium]
MMRIGMVMWQDRRMGRFYQDLLERLFDGALTVKAYFLDDGVPECDEEEFARLVITSSYSTDIIGKIPTDRPIISASLTFRREGLLALRRFPPGTKALVVNTSNKNAIDTTVLLCQQGIANIEFLPWGPDCPRYVDTKDVRLAVTPGESQLVPPEIEQVVDVGDRMLDVQSIIEIASQTGLEHILKGRAFREYDESITGGIRDVATPLLRSGRLKNEYDTVMNMIDIGVIGVDAKNIVYACNRKAEFLLGKSRGDILYLNIAEILPEIPVGRSGAENAPLTCRHEKAGNRALNITITPMRQENLYSGAMLMLLPVGEDETLKAQIVGKFMQKGHRARYTFGHVVGHSAAIRHRIDLAKKMADVDSAVLITGESGTGKEVFAQSIHNASARSDKPFVAINCAAIPDSLLESELFGYEGGSFTGARKQGKTGLFEAANHGTIFLDEIGDLSPSLQAKLLRVIQERQIMRVGGDAVIPIDARVISATNQDLLGRVRAGIFRVDLYYRISTLPVELPPLRERESDLFLLIDLFRREVGASFVLSSEAKKTLGGYSWPGNVRELRNCVEYLHCLKTDLIENHHLPSFILDRRDSGEENLPRKNAADDGVRAAAAILSQGPCGRGVLRSRLADREVRLTEAQTRALLANMKAKGWVESSGGRGGSALTKTGEEALLKD